MQNGSVPTPRDPLPPHGHERQPGRPEFGDDAQAIWNPDDEDAAEPGPDHRRCITPARRNRIHHTSTEEDPRGSLRSFAIRARREAVARFRAKVARAKARRKEH